MIKRKLLLFLFLLSAVVPCVFSMPLDRLVTSGQSSRLLSGDSIVETQSKNLSPKLLPFDVDLRQLVDTAMNTLDPNMMVETLHLYKKPEHSFASADSWDNAQKAGIFNQLLAISTMTGIEYYSASREEMRTFFEYSQVVDGPEKKYPLPDPVYASPPANISLYARQVDLTFGDNIYRYDYITTQNGIFLAQENLTALALASIPLVKIPVVKSNNLRSVIAVFDCGDTILIYAVSMVKAFAAPAMGERVGNSFSNRADAIIKWFSDRADIFFSDN